MHQECTGKDWRAALALAKHNIQQNFAVVGLLEHLNATMAVLEARLPRFGRSLIKYWLSPLSL